MWKQRKTGLFSRAYQQMMSSYFLGSKTSVPTSEWVFQKTNIAVINTLSSPILSAFGMELAYGMNIPLVTLGHLSWLCPIPRSWPSPAYWCEWSPEETALVLCAGAQDQPKHWCVISTSLATKAKHSSVQAARGNINLCSARPHTQRQ